MRRPFRVWMTGCLAVVMAGLGAGRTAYARDDAMLCSASRYGVAETVQRLADCAGRHGYAVFAQIDRGASGRRAPESVLVFRTAAGGTPVLMDGPNTEPSLPLSVRVRSDAQGRTEVVYAVTTWDGLPADLAHDLTELPTLIAEALA